MSRLDITRCPVLARPGWPDARGGLGASHKPKVQWSAPAASMTIFCPFAVVAAEKGDEGPAMLSDSCEYDFRSWLRLPGGHRGGQR